MAVRWREIIRSDTRSVEVASAAVLGLVGFWLCLPPSIFASNIEYRPMAAIASGEVWGVFLMLIGLAQTGVLLIQSRTGRYWMALLAVGAYSFIAMMFVLGALSGIEWPMYVGVAFTNFWASWHNRH